jgi:hypothetical protein
MRWITTLILCGVLAGCGKKASEASASKERFKIAMTRLSSADTPAKRFYALGDAAKGSFAAGKIADAKKYAEELLSLVPQFKDDRDYGTAMFNANLVLGRVALREGKVEDAKRCLITAGQSPLTPALASSGPNMSLANDLLAKGERQVVQDFLEQCRRLWLSNVGQLDKWIEEVKSGKTPDFGPNLTN